MRTLAVSLGNTTLFAGVFTGAKLVQMFRVPHPDLAALARRVRGRVDVIVLCSVVPARTAQLARLLEKKSGLAPLRLTSASPHGLRIAYRQPRKLGADRLAVALGARARHPEKNVIVVDCGTATTITGLRRDGVLLGGAILPGLALWPEMLAARTAQLPRVSLARPQAAVGRSPREAIASGVFHGHVGAIREVVARVRREAFGSAPVLVLGTGGHAERFAREKLFTVIEPALVLHGLRAFAAQP